MDPSTADGDNRVLNGYMQDFRLYNYNLPSSAISTIYNSGAPLPPFITCPTTVSCPSGTVHCTPSGTAVCCGAGRYFVEGLSTACQTCPIGTYGSGGTTSCTACPTVQLGVCTACPANSWSAAGAGQCTANMGYWAFNSIPEIWLPMQTSMTQNYGSAGATVTSSGSAAFYTNICNSGGGGCKNAVQFTGSTSDYLKIPTSYANPLTISFWMNVNDVSNYYIGYSLGSGSTCAWNMDVNPQSTGGKLTFYTAIPSQ